MRRLESSIFIAIFLFASAASASLCDHAINYCGMFGGSRQSSTPAYPSSSSSINLNPSSVPTDRGFGAEVLYFKSFDFSLVRGLGRVGAAISPSNSEDTFFGPPGFELPEDLLKRKLNQEKYASQKVTLATAFNLFDNKKQGLKRFQLNLGVMGKYNTLTNTPWPGGGVSGIAGPFTFGYSVYADEYLLDYAAYGLDQKSEIRYLVETYSIGVFLSSVALDYSVLRLIASDVSTVSVLTGSLLLKRGMLTVSARTEDSGRPVIDYQKKSLEAQRKKSDLFFGGQVSATKSLMLGAFYNYYALRELSVGATLFF